MVTNCLRSVCLRWVKLGNPDGQSGSPLRPQERTSSAGPVRSEKCQNRKWLALFDDLVGAGEQRGRHVKAQRLRGLEIDHEFEFG
jgi:hypothetical protein